MPLTWERRGRQARGMALGVVLMLVGCATLMGFAVVALVSFQMGLGIRQSAAHAARNAAESVLEIALARIGDSDGGFGQQGGESLRVEAPQGTVGLLTFAPGQVERVQGRAIQLPWSTYNFSPYQVTTAKAGYHRTVPRDAIHLVGTGITPDGVVRRVEAIVHFPPFDYALAAAGPVRLRGCTVAGIRDLTSVPRDGRGSPVLDPAQMSSGHVGTNADLRLERSLVKGDARAGASVTLLDTSVQGETRQQAEALRLPTFHLDAYDPGAQTVALELGDTLELPTLSGNARRTGNLQVPGDLVLDDGMLYVTGNLTVGGGIRGRGLVVVQGDLRVAGFSHVESSDSAALLCGGAVTLSGDGVFQGLVYCRGALKADHVTVLGCLIQDGGAPVELDQVRLFHSTARAAVSYHQQASLLLDFLKSEPDAAAFASLEEGKIISKTTTPDTPPWLEAVSGMQSGLAENSFEMTRFCRQHLVASITRRDGHYVYTCFQRLRHEITWCQGGDQEENVTDRYCQCDAPVERELQPGSPWASYPRTGMPGKVISIHEFTDRRRFIAKVINTASWTENLGTRWRAVPRDPGRIPALERMLAEQLDKAESSSTDLGRAGEVNLLINPSRFLAPYDRMRLLYWGDLSPP